MKKIAKNKVFTGFVVIATIISTVGLAGVLTPLLPARAAVTATAESHIMGGWNMTGGMMTSVAAFKITASGGEQLQSLKVRFQSVYGDATPATMLAAFNEAGAAGNDLQGLCIYKDGNNNGWFDPGSGDSVLVWETKPTWTDNGNGTFDVTLDVVNEALPTSYSVPWNYFVHMKMAAAPSAGKSFMFTFQTGAGNAVVTSGTAPSITAFSTAAITSGGFGGSYSTPPKLAAVHYMNYRELMFDFDKDMDSASTNCDETQTPGSCAAKYTLSTKASGDNATIISAARDNTNQSLVMLTAHADARISLSMEDNVLIATNPSVAPKDSTGMSYSDTMPVRPTWPIGNVKISEVSLAGVNTTDEFIELYNSFVSSESLAGWTVKAMVNNTTYATLATIGGGVTLEPGKHYLLANAANAYNVTLGADASFSGVDLTSGDTIFLFNAQGSLQDMVGIGTSAKLFQNNPYLTAPAATQSIERKALPTSTSVAMTTSDAALGNAYDSNNNSYDFVSRTVSQPQNMAATAETNGMVGGGTWTNSFPIVQHSPISMAVVGQEIVVHANVVDQETSFQALTVQLCYKAGNGSWPGTCVNGSMSYDVSFNIPASAVTANGIDYYIIVTDPASAVGIASSNPSATSAVLAQASPYRINVSAISGSRKISGTVYQSDCTTGVNGATVYVEGTGYNAVSAQSGGQDGVFSINGVQDGIYNLKASAGGYVDGKIWGVSVNSNNPSSGGWTFCLQSGTSGIGGNASAPKVVDMVPNDGMMGAPIDIVIDRAPIFIRFNKEMSSSTITCTDCQASTATIKFKKVVGGTAWNMGDDNTGSGGPNLSSQKYDIKLDTGSGATNRGVTVNMSGASLSSPVAVIDMVPLLEKSTDYIVEVTAAVKDIGGNQVEGNRPGGGHSVSWKTQSTDLNFSGGSGFGFTENAAYWQGNNFTTMKANEGYQTMMGQFNATTGTWAGGQYSPLFVKGSQPMPGAWNVSRNLSMIVIEFSEPIDVNSVNTGSFNLYTVNNATFADVTSTYISGVSLTSDKLKAKMAVSTTLPAGSYEVRVKAGVRAVSGITLGDPNNPGNNHYFSNFTVASTTDSNAPSVNGSWPDNNATNVPLDFGFIDLGFSEALDPTNINSSTVTLRAGTTEVPTTIKYDSAAQAMKIIPSTGLTAGTQYTVSISLGGSSGIKDLYGQPTSSSTLTRLFTMTTTADITKPRVEFANCDGYSCAITFSKPMSSMKQSEATSNANLWVGSVRNPGNYAITYGANGTGSSITLTGSGVSFNYEYDSNTIVMKGLAFAGATKGTTQFIITVSNVVDVMNNPIDATATTSKGVIKDEAKTGGMLGPSSGCMGGCGGAITAGGSSGFGTFSGKEAMMMGAMVMPMNMMAGATTSYFVDFPVPTSGKGANSLNDGSYVKLTFPKGVTITSAIPDPYNPNKSDLNMQGPSTVKLKTSGVTDDGASATTKGGAADDGVTISGQTLTLWLNTNGGTTGDPDFFHFEIKDIVNPTKVQDFNSSGYNVDMKAYKADGTMVASVTSMPFFVNSSGSNNVTVPITATGGAGTFKLMMGSPKTGPMDATVTVVGGTGTQTWSSLPDGCYSIFTEPTITLGAAKYSGQMNPEPLCLPGSGANWNAGTSTLTKAITLTAFSGANSASLSVKITGTFDAAGEDVDIFANGPNSFSASAVTLTGAVVNNTSTLYFPVNGTYMVGVGPAMPKGPMMGPPPMPAWMPPTNVQVNISGIGGTPVVKNALTGETITSLSFTVSTASKEIRGRVISKQTTLGATYTANATSLTVAGGSGFAANDFIAITDGTNTSTDKILSISGTTVQLTNGISQGFASGSTVYNVLPTVELWASQPMGFGGSGSHTQSLADGSFVLKVAANGTYDLGAYKPGIGDAPFRSVTVKDNDVTTVDGNTTCDVRIDGANVTTASPLLIKLAKPDYIISGKVLDSGGNAMMYTSVRAEESTTHQMVHAMTDSTGSFIINVSLGTWLVKVEMPQGADTCGSISSTIYVTESTGNQENQVLSPTSMTCYAISGTVTLGGTVQANIPIMVETWDTVNDWPSGGYRRHENVGNAGTYSVKAGNGTYRVSIWSPTYGEIGKNVTVNGANQTVDITYDASNLKTLTLSFTGATANMKGFAEVKETSASATTNGRGAVRKGSPLPDLSQNQTISVPAGTYQVKVFVDGMGDFSPASNVDLTTTNQSVAVDLSAQTLRTVSGTVLDNDGDPVANAAVILVNETSGLTKQDTTDASGNYSISIKEGTYSIKADHKDYASPAKYSNLAVTANKDFDFDSNLLGEDVAVDNDLVEKTVSISGTIYESDGSSSMDLGGFVYATEATAGSKAKAAIEDDGTYKMAVTDGTWTIKADGPLHAETTRGTTVTISGASATAKDITLTADATDVKKTDSRSITPTIGVTVNDTNNTGVELNAGSGIIGGQNTSGTLQIDEVDLPDLDMTKVLGNGAEITAKAGGEDVNTLGGDGAEITLHYTAAEISAAGVTNEATLTLSYYDETTDTYMPLSNQTCNTTDNYCTGTITHLTSIAITHPPLQAAGNTRRDTEEENVGGGGGGAPAPVQEVKAEEKTLVVVEEVKPVAVVVTTEQTVKDAVKEVTKTIVSQVVALTNVVPAKPATRELSKEIQGTKDFAKLVGKNPAKANDWQVVDYLAYGTTPKIKGLTLAERTGLLQDYKKIYSKLPSTEKDWTDLGKIAQGTTPSRVIGLEAEAVKVFAKIFGRAVDFKKSTEEKFVHGVAYYLRVENRDIAKEKAALSMFKKAYKKAPTTGFMWSVVRGVAYAGVSSEVSAPATPVAPAPAAPVAPVAEEVILNAVPVQPSTAERNLKAELSAVTSYTKIAGKSASGTAWTVVHFLAYGSTDASKAKTAVERLSVLKAYKVKYGKLPVNEADWQNLAKLIK